MGSCSKPRGFRAPPNPLVVMPAQAGIQYPRCAFEPRSQWLLGPRLRGDDAEARRTLATTRLLRASSVKSAHATLAQTIGHRAPQRRGFGGAQARGVRR